MNYLKCVWNACNTFLILELCHLIFTMAHASCVFNRLALASILNGKMDNFLCVVAMVCSTYVTINKGTSKRYPWSPEGDTSIRSVVDGNLMANRRPSNKSYYSLWVFWSGRGLENPSKNLWNSKIWRCVWGKTVKVLGFIPKHQFFPYISLIYLGYFWPVWWQHVLNQCCCFITNYVFESNTMVWKKQA